MDPNQSQLMAISNDILEMISEYGGIKLISKLWCAGNRLLWQKLQISVKIFRYDSLGPTLRSWPSITRHFPLLRKIRLHLPHGQLCPSNDFSLSFLHPLKTLEEVSIQCDNWERMMMDCLKTSVNNGHVTTISLIPLGEIFSYLKTLKLRSSTPELFGNVRFEEKVDFPSSLTHLAIESRNMSVSTLFRLPESLVTLDLSVSEVDGDYSWLLKLKHLYCLSITGISDISPTIWSYIPSTLLELTLSATAHRCDVKLPPQLKKLDCPHITLQRSDIPSQLVYLKCRVDCIELIRMIESLPNTVTYLGLSHPDPRNFDPVFTDSVPSRMPPNLRFLSLTIQVDWEVWISRLPPTITAFHMEKFYFFSKPLLSTSDSRFKQAVSHLPLLYSVWDSYYWCYTVPLLHDPIECDNDQLHLHSSEPNSGSGSSSRSRIDSGSTDTIWISVTEQLLTLPCALHYLKHIYRMHPEEIMLQSPLLDWCVRFNRPHIVEWLIEIGFDFHRAISHGPPNTTSPFARAMRCIKGKEMTAMVDILLHGLKVRLDQVNSTLGLYGYSNMLHYIVSLYHLGPFQSDDDVIEILDWFNQHNPSHEFWTACSTSSPFILASLNLSWPIVDWMMEKKREATDITILIPLLVQRHKRENIIPHLISASYGLDLLHALEKDTEALSTFLAISELPNFLKTTPMSPQVRNWIELRLGNINK